MRKVIKGKLYDTTTAREVAYWSNGWGGSDYHSSTLYRKRTGEYFTHDVHGEYEISNTIIPLTLAEARHWCESFADDVTYLAEFGIPDEGDTHDLHVIVSEAAWQALSHKAASDSIPVSKLIEQLAAAL